MSFPVYATSPLVWALVLAVLLAIGWRGLPLGLRIPGIFVEVLLVVLMTPLGASALARSVQMRVPPPSTCPTPLPTTVVVLAGGFARGAVSPDDFGALHLITLQRVFAGVALWEHIPDGRLVFSGGGGFRQREAVVMSNLAVQLGVPAGAIEIEDTSHNTWENARNVAALSPRVPQRIWLVTSALHLPRALGAFRAWGFEPCAWSSDPLPPRIQIWAGAFVPQGQSARKAAIAFHEIIGGWEYALREFWHARHASGSR